MNDPKALQGYTLLAPMQSNKTYLIDMEGRRGSHVEKRLHARVERVTCSKTANCSAPRHSGKGECSLAPGRGAGGRIQKIGWNDELIWDFESTSDKQFPHHDVAALPNGNVVMIAWDKKTAEDATAAGRRVESVPNGLMVDSLVEIKPTGKTTGEVVWEWHLWDHLIQDHDKTKANYGTVSAHPELVDLNFGQDVVGGIAATPDGANNLLHRLCRKHAKSAQWPRTWRTGAWKSRLDAHQLGGVQRRSLSARRQRSQLQRNLDYRSQHDRSRSRQP